MLQNAISHPCLHVQLVTDPTEGCGDESQDRGHGARTERPYARLEAWFCARQRWPDVHLQLLPLDVDEFDGDFYVSAIFTQYPHVLHAIAKA